jgi:GT2 family glycosyltransferase
MKIKVAIVILNWNGKEFLRKFLPQVIQYSEGPGIQIVIADNNSSDDSVEFLKNSYPQIEVITFKRNYGYARGYAIALPQIMAEYYVLLNSDVEVTENWLEPIIRLMDNNPLIAAAMPKIRSYFRKDYFEYAGAAGGFIDKFAYPFCQGRIITNIEKDEGQYNESREIFWASGACMFLRSDAYSKTGGLDGDFFAHMEEIDLCWRLKRLGYSIYYCSDSLIYHVGGGTLPNDNPRKLYYNYRNSLYLLFKNISKKEFFTILIPRMILDGLSATAYLLQGKLLFFLAVLRAHIRFYLSLRMLVHKRKIYNRIIDKTNVGHIYPHTIVFDFFIRKKRIFSELNFNQ